MMRKYVLNLSDISNWNQLRLILANTFSIDFEKLNEIDKLWELLDDRIFENTQITVYGLGKMAEELPELASGLRSTIDSIEQESILDVEVRYENSEAYIKK